MTGAPRSARAGGLERRGLAVFFDVFRSGRVVAMLPLGFAAGLPLMLTGETLATWMRNEGVDLQTIGIFSLVSLPYSLKFLWAPLLDRYRLPLLGRRRGWMVLLQLALAGAIAALGTVEPKSTPATMAQLAVLVAFLSASYDIVLDAYRTDVLADRERAAGAATYVTGYRVAMLVSGGAALMLSEWLSWRSVYWIMAAGMSVGVLATWMAPEPEKAAAPPLSLRAAIVEPFIDYFRRRGALVVLLVIALYRVGDALARTMLNPFLVDLGFSNLEIGSINKILGLSATILGALAGGGLVVTLGLRRALLTFGALAAAGNLLYMALALVGASLGLLVVAVAVDNLAYGLAVGAFTAFLMSLCNRSFSAFQYALFSSLSSVVGRLLGAPSGALAESVGWPSFFLVTALAALPALILLVWAPPDAARPPEP
jgi:MFS transporter, PAT family, beta-lactamase induction signal transducer AmpG